MKDKTIALVTGANRGIGLEVCRQLARRGSVVLLSARDLAKATAAAGELSPQGSPVHAIALDVSEDKSVAAAVGWIESKQRRVSWLDRHLPRRGGTRRPACGRGCGERGLGRDTAR